MGDGLFIEGLVGRLNTEGLGEELKQTGDYKLLG